MESIIVYPENEAQKSLLKSLLEGLRIRFEVGKTTFTEEEFYAKIDRAIRQAELGQVTTISKEEQKKLLGL